MVELLQLKAETEYLGARSYGKFNYKTGFSISGPEVFPLEFCLRLNIIECFAERCRHRFLGSPERESFHIFPVPFAVIHQISSPLSIHADTDRYDGAWTGSGARQRLKQFRQQYDTYLYKRYDDDLKH